MYIKVQRPHRVTWGLWGIGSSGLRLSIASNSLGMLGQKLFPGCDLMLGRK
jgi:hypothetical protein